jgi:ribonuclease BN (tRNA processing enzyme)
VRLTVIGCAGGFCTPDSAASCYLVEADDAAGRTWRILLDLGSGALGPLQRRLAPRDVDAVLLSHLHPDHFLDLCGMYVALRYHPDGPPPGRIPVYGPAGTAGRLADAYGAREGRGLTRVYDIRTWDDGKPVTIGPLAVVPSAVDHPVPAFGLRVEHGTATGTTVLAYSGDSDACPNLTDLARGADVLLAEASFTEGRDLARHIHLTGLRAGRTAADAGVGRLLLTHLPVWTDPRTALAEARSVFTGEIGVVRPGDRYDV